MSLSITRNDYRKSSQVKYIYIALFTIQIVSKLLHSINQDNITVFVYSWKKTIFKYPQTKQKNQRPESKLL